MDLERLSEFVKIVENGSVSETAARLGISAATLSARLHTFESKLGCSLFDRKGKTLFLNESGQYMYPNLFAIITSLPKFSSEGINLMRINAKYYL